LNGLLRVGEMRQKINLVLTIVVFGFLGVFSILPLAKTILANPGKFYQDFVINSFLPCFVVALVVVVIGALFLIPFIMLKNIIKKKKGSKPNT
jgi:ABC-type enterochelin transport system permease subunit